MRLGLHHLQDQVRPRRERVLLYRLGRWAGDGEDERRLMQGREERCLQQGPERMPPQTLQAMRLRLRLIHE